MKGYEDEPYLRFLPNRVVEENTAIAFEVRERGPLRAHAAARRRPTPRRRPKWRAVSRDGSLPVVRPPHPLDGEGHAAAGEGRGRAHEDLRLARPDDGRRTRRSQAVGTLEWVPADLVGLSRPACSSALGALAILVLAALAFLLTRRRRPRPAGRGAPSGERQKPAERSVVRHLRAALGCARRCGAASSLPASAMAHAVLESTEPLSGSTSKQPVDQVVFRFSEPVEGNFGAIRVFDRRGARIDEGEVFHPGGQGPELGVRAEAGARQGQLHRDLPRDLRRQPPGRRRSRVQLREGDRRPAPPCRSCSPSRARAAEVTDIAFGAAKATQYGVDRRRRSERSSSCS